MGKTRPPQWIPGEACNGHDAPGRRRGAVKRMHVVQRPSWPSRLS